MRNHMQYFINVVFLNLSFLFILRLITYFPRSLLKRPFSKSHILFIYLHFHIFTFCYPPHFFCFLCNFFIFTIDILPFRRLAPLAFVKVEGGKLYA